MPAGDIARWLAQAGWHPDRRVDVDGMNGSLREAGFPVSRAGVAFLESFGRLKLVHEPSIELTNGRSSCWTEFDPTVVATPRDARVAGRCSAIAGRALCPVGVDGFHLTLYVADDATFSAGVDASVFHCADSAGELFRAMLDGQRPRRIGDWQLA
jgi:hypothetical protein